MNPLRPILKPPPTVRKRPQPDEKKSGSETTLGQIFVLEEAGFDISSSWHYRAL
jgi:hypothetical protein